MKTVGVLNEPFHLLPNDSSDCSWFLFFICLSYLWLYHCQALLWKMVSLVHSCMHAQNVGQYRRLYHMYSQTHQVDCTFNHCLLGCCPYLQLCAFVMPQYNTGVPNKDPTSSITHGADEFLTVCQSCTLFWLLNWNHKIWRKYGSSKNGENWINVQWMISLFWLHQNSEVLYIT